MKRINPYKLFIGAFLPNWLLRRRELSQGAKLCYARLAQYAGEHGYARPGQKTLADELAVTERQIRNYVAELEKHKLIESAQVTFAGTNRYYFLWHEWMEMDEPTETTDPSNAEEDCRIDRKKTSALSGSKLPVYPEEDFRSIRQDTSTKENQLRESEEENQKDTTPPTPLPGDATPSGENLTDENAKTSFPSDPLQGNFPQESAPNQTVVLLAPEKAPKKGRQKAPKMPVPDDFGVTDDMRTWATKEAPQVNLERETIKLIAWARGKGELKADWLATWQGWMCRRQDEIEQKQPLARKGLVF